MPERKQAALTIRILGRDYPVACPEGEREALLASAEYVSKRMQAIQKQGKTLGVDRVAVMAALNIARELLAAQRAGDTPQAPKDAAHPAPAADLDQRLSQLQLRIESALDESG